MSIKRKAMLAHVKKQMIDAGEIAAPMEDEFEPRSAQEAREYAMREAFLGEGTSRSFKRLENNAEAQERAYVDWHEKLEKRRAKRNFMKSSKRQASYAKRSDPTRDDFTGVTYTDLETGTPCVIIPIEAKNKKTGLPEIVETGWEGWPDGTCVTAFFTNLQPSRWHHHGNREVDCLMPDGTTMAISKMRLDILFDDVEEEDIDDLFEDEE